MGKTGITSAITQLPGFCRVPAGFLPGFAGLLPVLQKPGSCVMADVIGFCGKLLELSVKCLVLCGRYNTGLSKD
jgi:hypothetical protein